MTNDVDISENTLLERHPKVLEILLQDHTTHKNIFWATDSYAEKGKGFRFEDEIEIEHITGKNGRVIQPRSVKDLQIQNQRVRNMAEVFTPSWVCNAQNNLIDNEWFGRDNIFNIENSIDHIWEPRRDIITFPEGKSWRDYVRDIRLEVACGEGPYIASRYDAVSGKPITDLYMRIGFLDRKLRIVSENTTTSRDWLKWAKEALKSSYGFEWQGDNLLLARETVLYTFCDYYENKFGKPVPPVSLPSIADIISWNLWQMDGLKLVIPCSCEEQYEEDIFGQKIKKECYACKNGLFTGHIGIQCKVKDWSYTGNLENKKTPFFESFVNVK